jgi:type III secretion protein F
MATKKIDGAGGDLGQTTVDDSSGQSAWNTLLEKTFVTDAGTNNRGFLSSFSSLFDTNVKVKKGALDDALQKVTADASDPEALAKYQAALAEYTLYRNAQSNAVKAYKDVDANTIRNFN